MLVFIAICKIQICGSFLEIPKKKFVTKGLHGVLIIEFLPNINFNCRILFWSLNSRTLFTSSRKMRCLKEFCSRKDLFCLHWNQIEWRRCQDRWYSKKPGQIPRSLECLQPHQDIRSLCKLRFCECFRIIYSFLSSAWSCSWLLTIIINWRRII